MKRVALVVAAGLLAACTSSPGAPATGNSATSTAAHPLENASPRTSPFVTAVPSRLESPTKAPAIPGLSTHPIVGWGGIATAWDGTLYEVQTLADGRRIKISSIAKDWATRSHVASLGDIADFVASAAAGASGLYLSTGVIKRFDDIPDAVFRVNPKTLHVVARRQLTDRATVYVLEGRVYLVSTSTIERIDPLSLRTLVSYTRHGLPEPDGRPQPFGDLVVFKGALWVTYGNLARQDITRLDPDDLHLLAGSWPVPQQQGIRLAATTTGIWRTGLTSVARLLPGGKIAPAVVLPAPTDNVLAFGSSLLAINGDPEPFFVVHADGTTETLPFTASTGACAGPTSDGADVWMFCDPHRLLRLPIP
jgi:hypothetical protein